MFSSLDAASVFWKIPLHQDSCRLTTFITPFGRYCFKRLPFGISSAPEIFQRKVLETVQGLDGVEVFMGNILVCGPSLEQQDTHLEKVQQRIVNRITAELQEMQPDKTNCGSCVT